jgi:hypothetical protein
MEHATFSPSQPSWLNYDDDDLINAYCNAQRAALGTEIHEWSSAQIKLSNKVSNIKEIEKGVKTHIFEKYTGTAIDYGKMLLQNMDYLPREIYPTVKMFVNDAIGFHMASEQRVEYSDLCWGTSDAIVCIDNNLFIFDLKTGSRPAKETQLFVYAALFCLQEHTKPNELEIETRIYQNGDALITKPPSDVIYDIMSKIVHLDTVIGKFKGRR